VDKNGNPVRQRILTSKQCHVEICYALLFVARIGFGRIGKDIWYRMVYEISNIDS
jgi:hypothetical protein